MKKIVIKTCEDCPHKDHKGGYGKVMYIPVCRLENKEIPHTVGLAKLHKSERLMATYSGTIPVWCPLENDN